MRVNRFLVQAYAEIHSQDAAFCRALDPGGVSVAGFGPGAIVSYRSCVVDVVMVSWPGGRRRMAPQPVQHQGPARSFTRRGGIRQTIPPPTRPLERTAPCATHQASSGEQQRTGRYSVVSGRSNSAARGAMTKYLITRGELAGPFNRPRADAGASWRPAPRSGCWTASCRRSMATARPAHARCRVHRRRHARLGSEAGCWRARCGGASRRAGSSTSRPRLGVGQSMYEIAPATQRRTIWAPPGAAGGD